METLIRRLQIALTKFVISHSVADAVRMRLADEMTGGGLGVAGKDCPVGCCMAEDEVPLRPSSDSPLMRLKGIESLAESTICATLIMSTPTSFCSAKTVAKCSGGYSSSRKRTSLFATRNVSRWGTKSVASRYEFVKGLSVWCASGWAVKACMALAMRYLSWLVIFRPVRDKDSPEVKTSAAMSAAWFCTEFLQSADNL